MYELQFIRTDKNGTKIYHDWACPRCGGAGRSDNWWKSGFTCYACGGTGKRNTPKEVKEYTPEYAAKLEARRIAKLAKQPKPDEAELLARAEEAKRNRWKDEGFTEEGVAYLYLGNTYEHKTKIRIAGGVWNSWIRAWVAPNKVEGLQGVQVIEIHAQDVCNECDYIDYEKIEKIKESI